MKRVSISAKNKYPLLITFGVAILGLVAQGANAQTLNVIHTFTGGSDGGIPLGGFVMGPSGNLFGTASVGGSFGAGVVYAFSESGEEKVLYNFTGGADGANPQSSLIFDPSGNLYGTTYAGGVYGAGTIFVVTAAGEEKVLYSFSGAADGANPIAKLSFDTSGNIYGTTFAGGAYGGGTVFELIRGGTETVLHSFGNRSDGANPVAGITLTKKGVIFGTTSAGGTSGYGTIFRLALNQSTWVETILHNFQMDADGGTPYAGLVYDQSGNLYGTTTAGGGGGSNPENGGGTVFELTPSSSGWNFSIIDGPLSGSGVSGTYRNVLLDASGNIYATTHCDGAYGAGTVYELTPSGGAWTYNSLYVFTGNEGYFLYSNLVFDTQGNLYGTASSGGAHSYGIVFKITP